MNVSHQYIERATGQILDERFLGDRLIRMIYSPVRENAPALFNLLTSARVSTLLAAANYDIPLRGFHKRFIRDHRDWSECLEPEEVVKTPRAYFQRKIKYWECRPLDGHPDVVTSPADSRVIVGSLEDHSILFIKRKFFCLEELLGLDKHLWVDVFRDADFAVFRLTPDKYHYNHTPVSGKVVDFYVVPGGYHSCNPSAVMALADMYSKNKRVVTIIDTDVLNGTRIGLVAMIEVVALMIGDIAQCYSQYRYESPRRINKEMFLEKGVPKSLFRPGSSTVILLFEKERMQFSSDLLSNLHRQDVKSRLSQGLAGKPLVETDVEVRSEIALALR
ncbi:MAG: phosphatidylserine decarboxylase [Thermodesulfobacteriota bacterium]|nr:phosphatidylserine decarboxylase [Thermodesulfobacteriota bacterium]